MLSDEINPLPFLEVCQRFFADIVHRTVFLVAFVHSWIFWVAFIHLQDFHKNLIRWLLHSWSNEFQPSEENRRDKQVHLPPPLRHLQPRLLALLPARQGEQWNLQDGGRLISNQSSCGLLEQIIYTVGPKYKWPKNRRTSERQVIKHVYFQKGKIHHVIVQSSIPLSHLGLWCFGNIRVIPSHFVIFVVKIRFYNRFMWFFVRKWCKNYPFHCS